MRLKCLKPLFFILVGALSVALGRRPDAASVVANIDAGTSHRIIALTFDDGPDIRYTPAVLNILEEKAVRATFFLVGREAAAHRDLVLQEHLSGHELANHTWSHFTLTSLPWYRTVEELTRTQDIVQSITGSRTKYFRPPRGEFDNEDIKAAKAMGYTIAMWTVCIENKTADTPAAMVERVMKRVHPGSVILLHDGLMDRSKTVTALPMLIDRLQLEGYRFVTLTRLLKSIGRDNVPVR